MCSAKSLGAAKIRDCHLGKTTPYVVARELECTYEQVMCHINEQHEIKVDDEGYFQSEDVLLAKLASNMRTLDQWTEYVIKTVNKPSDVDRSKVDMLVKLTQEIRRTVESIAELQGRLGPGDTVVQIQILNGRVMDMTNMILDNSCPECKMKILEAMEARRICQPNVPLLTTRP